MKFGHWPKFQTLHIFLSQRLEIESFLLYGQRFPRYGPIFKIALFGREIWPLAKVLEVAHGLSFYPRVSKLRLFLLYGQQFPRRWPIFKHALFGHDTWPLAKVLEVAHIYSFYPGWVGLKLSLFSLYGQRFPRYAPIFN